MLDKESFYYVNDPAREKIDRATILIEKDKTASRGVISRLLEGGTLDEGDLKDILEERKQKSPLTQRAMTALRDVREKITSTVKAHPKQMIAAGVLVLAGTAAGPGVPYGKKLMQEREERAQIAAQQAAEEAKRHQEIIDAATVRYKEEVEKRNKYPKDALAEHLKSNRILRSQAETQCPLFIDPSHASEEAQFLGLESIDPKKVNDARFAPTYEKSKLYYSDWKYLSNGSPEMPYYLYCDGNTIPSFSFKTSPPSSSNQGDTSSAKTKEQHSSHSEPLEQLNWPLTDFGAEDTPWPVYENCVMGAAYYRDAAGTQTCLVLPEIIASFNTLQASDCRSFKSKDLLYDESLQEAHAVFAYRRKVCGELFNRINDLMEQQGE